MLAAFTSLTEALKNNSGEESILVHGFTPSCQAENPSLAAGTEGEAAHMVAGQEAASWARTG